MSENKRHIELAVVKVDGDQVTFRIAEQTHRGDTFAASGYEFTSSSGYNIVSGVSPRSAECCNMLYVRGMNSTDDNIKMTVNLKNFARIMEAVNEYNDTDGGVEQKAEWPQNGDWYFYVASDGEVGNCKYDPEKYTHRRMEEIGNFFRTYVEAEAALERVKKVLKGEENE